MENLQKQFDFVSVTQIVRLKKFGMESCKPVSTPLEPGRKFQQLAPSDEPFDVQTYQQAIGCLTYISTATRPDIAAAVGVLSQYRLCQSQVRITGWA